MNKLKNILFVLIATLIFVGCDEEDPQLFSNSQAFVKFESSIASVNETGDILKVVVQVSDLNRKAAVTVDFDFDLTDIANPAVAGEDYLLMNDSKTLTFPKGVYQDTIFIKTVDNDLYEKDKAFKIVLKSNNAEYLMGVADSEIGTTIDCTVVDDEHPLALVLGTYTEADYLLDGTLEATYVITIKPDPLDETKVILDNFWEGGELLSANVDIVNKTITIPAKQVMYVSGTYGDCIMTARAGSGIDPNAPILGTFDDNGTITIAPWSAIVAAGSFGNYSSSVLTK